MREPNMPFVTGKLNTILCAFSARITSSAASASDACLRTLIVEAGPRMTVFTLYDARLALKCTLFEGQLKWPNTQPTALGRTVDEQRCNMTHQLAKRIAPNSDNGTAFISIVDWVVPFRPCSRGLRELQKALSVFNCCNITLAEYVSWLSYSQLEYGVVQVRYCWFQIIIVCEFDNLRNIVFHRRNWMLFVDRHYSWRAAQLCLVFWSVYFLGQSNSKHFRFNAMWDHPSAANRISRNDLVQSIKWCHTPNHH